VRWREVVSEVARRTGASDAETGRTLQAFVDVVYEAVVAGEEVRIPRLIQLGRRWREPRKLRSVKDSRRMALDGRFVPRLRSAGALRDGLAAITPQLLREPEHQAAWRLACALVGDLELYHADRLPQELADQGAPGEVEQACAQALGPAWQSARDTFDRSTPPGVQAARDYLVHVAHERWAGAPG